MAIDKSQIVYEELGDSSKCLVILQGWGTSYSVYRAVAEYFATRYRVVMFDFPGFGGSPEPDEAWGVAEYAQFTREFIQQLGISHVSFFAHSFGGRVVFELASQQDLAFSIDHLYLVDVAGIRPQRTFTQRARVAKYKTLRTLANFAPVYWLFPELIDAWRARQGSADYRAASPLMRQVLVKSVNYDQTHLIGKVDIPTDIIWGGADTDTTAEMGQAIHALIKNSTFIMLPESGHFPFADNPQEFFAALEQAVERADGSAQATPDGGEASV